MVASAGLLAVLVVVLAVSGEVGFAFSVAVPGPLTVAAAYDAGRSRIELDRWRQLYGTLPPEDDA